MRFQGLAKLFVHVLPIQRRQDGREGDALCMSDTGRRPTANFNRADSTVRPHNFRRRLEPQRL